MPTKGFTDSGTRRVSYFDPAISSNYAASLWRTCPLLEYMHDPSIGILLDEQFNNYDATSTTGDYVLTQAGAAGSAAKSTTIPGTLSITAGSSTATQGANVQRTKSMFLPAANKSIWFECKFNISGITNLNVQTFIGLAEIDTSIIASSAISTSNHMGWYSVTADGVLLFAANKATVATTATGVTIASATSVRLGFVYDGVTDTLQQYVNGVATGTAIATANIPKVALYPSFVCQADTTDTPILHVEGYRVFQLR